jgi:hypothetical protein
LLEARGLLMNQQEHPQFEIQGCPHCLLLRWGMDLELGSFDLVVMGPENSSGSWSTPNLYANTSKWKKVKYYTII